MIIALQLALLFLAIATIVDWCRCFPAPPRVTRWLLPAEKRWPVEQLWKWVEDGNPDPGFLRFFLRDPDRSPPPGGGLVAPVDGTVLADVDDLGRRYLVISLKVWDVHVARSPCTAFVRAIGEHGDAIEPTRTDPLRNQAFYFLREKSSPKQRYLELDTEVGLMRLRFITSYLSRRIEFFCQPGQEIARGERIGRMLFGSTCVVELDAGHRFGVRPGSRLVGGETIISRERAE